MTPHKLVKVSPDKNMWLCKCGHGSGTSGPIGWRNHSGSSTPSGDMDDCLNPHEPTCVSDGDNSWTCKCGHTSAADSNPHELAVHMGWGHWAAKNRWEDWAGAPYVPRAGTPAPRSKLSDEYASRDAAAEALENAIMLGEFDPYVSRLMKALATRL